MHPQQELRNPTPYHRRLHEVVAGAAVLATSLSTSKSLSSSSASFAAAAESTGHSFPRRPPAAAEAAVVAAAAAPSTMPFAASPLEDDIDADFQYDFVDLSLSPNPRPPLSSSPTRNTTPAAAASPFARHSFTPPGAPTSPFASALLGAVLNVRHRGGDAARFATLRADLPLSSNDDRLTPNDGGGVGLVTKQTRAMPYIAEPPHGRPPFPSCSRRESPDDRVGDFVREAMNEADIPPGLLRFLRGQKQPGEHSPTTTATTSSSPSLLPPAYATAPTSAQRAPHPTTPESANTRRPGSVPMLPPVPLASPLAGHLSPYQQQQQQQQQQQPQQTLPRPSVTKGVPQPLWSAEITAKYHGNDTSTNNVSTGTAASATTMHSEAQGMQELTEYGHHLRSHPLASPGNVAMGEGSTAQHAALQQPSARSESDSSSSGSRQTCSGGEVTRSLSTTRTAPAELSATQPLDSTQSSPADANLPCRFTPSPPTTAQGSGQETLSGGGGPRGCRRRVADLESKDESFRLQSFRKSPPAHCVGSVASFPYSISAAGGTVPPGQLGRMIPTSDSNGLAGLPEHGGCNAGSGSGGGHNGRLNPFQEEEEEEEENGVCVVQRRQDIPDDLFEGSSDEEATVLSSASSGGVVQALAVSAAVAEGEVGPMQPQERQRRYNSTRRFPKPLRSIYSVSCASPLPMELVHAPTHAPTHAPNTAATTTTAANTNATAMVSFADGLAVTPLFSMPLSTNVSTASSSHKRRALFIARNMEDAPPLIQEKQQQLLQQQQQSQPHSPRQHAQLSLRRSRSTFFGSFTGASFPLNDSAEVMSYVDSNITTPLSPNGELEPSLMAGVAWMDSFSPYTSCTSPSTTLNTTTNLCSTVHASSALLSFGVPPAAALALSERSDARMGGRVFGSASQSSTSRHHRRPQSATTQHTSGFSGHSVNVSFSVPSSNAMLLSPHSPGKYSGRQCSHERRAVGSQQQKYYHPHPMLTRSASSGPSMANSSVSSNVPALLIPDRSSVAAELGGSPAHRQRQHRRQQQHQQVSTTTPIGDCAFSRSLSAPSTSSAATSVLSFMPSPSTSAL
ncbi:hypothetical protein ABB37_08444 [Leptomonas pyrrhocoris]|uniref:Uncharacterized protein n=1 Tax=Leptomonas pyrrhocoris TaxID=157538 RepID=A0A0N0VDH2_LEPPY|nr:hypothetical protein ABB37_08444 [Leptomonas pyrrhocoris]KPA75558.1 hypothetical protein ABB37_08444 [Leptomonas pyrrhocoris]|eukprot:XP_015653997.1 hypothetical protein ABB37_08444 [Leptomonas pyrrhocoris]